MTSDMLLIGPGYLRDLPTMMARRVVGWFGRRHTCLLRHHLASFILLFLACASSCFSTSWISLHRHNRRPYSTAPSSRRPSFSARPTQCLPCCCTRPVTSAQSWRSSSSTAYSVCTGTHPLYASNQPQSESRDGSFNALPGMPSSTNGVAVLLTVPAAWGTFEVAIRSVYALEPKVPAVLFALAYYTVASLALLVLAAILGPSAAGTTRVSTTDTPKPKDDATVEVAMATVAESSGTAASGQRLGFADKSVANPVSPTGVDTSWPIQGGLELGFYLFLGNLCQMIGLQTVTADRAAFLLQLTTIFVPLAQAAVVDQSWSAITPRLWLACVVALAGVGIMSLDHAQTHGESSSSLESSGFGTATQESFDWGRVLQSFDQGDGFTGSTTLLPYWGMGETLIVLAAVAYTFHCLRLEVYARSTMAIRLGACKAVTETMWSALTVATVVAVAATATTSSSHSLQLPLSATSALLDATSIRAILSSTGQECLDYIATMQSSNIAWSSGSGLSAVLAVLWTGLVPVAYTIVAQSYGQGKGGVRPVTANLIYTIQPVCTALFAYLLLHESLGLAGYVGGAMIGAAVLLVVLQD